MEYLLRKVNGETSDTIIETDEVMITMGTLDFGSIVDRVNILGKCKLHLDGKSVELIEYNADIMQLDASVQYKGWKTKLDLEFDKETFTPKLVRLLTED